MISNHRLERSFFSYSIEMEKYTTEYSKPVLIVIDEQQVVYDEVYIPADFRLCREHPLFWKYVFIRLYDLDILQLCNRFFDLRESS